MFCLNDTRIIKIESLNNINFFHHSVFLTFNCPFDLDRIIICFRVMIGLYITEGSLYSDEIQFEGIQWTGNTPIRVN